MHDGDNSSGELSKERHTLKEGDDSTSIIKLPNIVLKDEVVEEWFSIDSVRYSSLLALRFRLLFLRLYVYKNGRRVPSKIRNNSTFEMRVSYDEYRQLFIDDNRLSCEKSEILGEIMYLFCFLSDVSEEETEDVDWMTFLGMEMFSAGYLVEDEKAFWYITISECNNIEYTLPDNKSVGWVKRVLSYYLDGTGGSDCNGDSNAKNSSISSSDCMSDVADGGSSGIRNIGNSVASGGERESQVGGRIDSIVNGNKNFGSITSSIDSEDLNQKLSRFTEQEEGFIGNNEETMIYYKSLFEKRGLYSAGEREFNHSCFLNPINYFLDFSIISIIELLVNPKYADHRSVFKKIECDPVALSKIRLTSNFHKLGRCSQIWSGQHIAYRCLTCGITTSSCICVDCFQNGNHENHDYYIYKSDYGGCCDCGDEQAWSRSGFCNNHNHGIVDKNGKNSNKRNISDRKTGNLVTLRLKGLFHGILCHIIMLSHSQCTIPDTKELLLPFHSKLLSAVIEKNKNDVIEGGVEGTHFLLEGEILQDLENGNTNNDNNGNDVIQSVLSSGSVANQNQNQIQVHIQNRDDQNQDQNRNQIQVRIHFQVQNGNFQTFGGTRRANEAPTLAGNAMNNIPNANNTRGGAGSDDGDFSDNYPVVLLLKQEPSFQMDSYFFEWFMYLTENYQSVFLPLLGELFGSQIHDLFLYGKKRECDRSSTEYRKRNCIPKNKDVTEMSKVLRTFVEDRFGRMDRQNLSIRNTKKLLAYLHPEFVANGDINSPHLRNGVSYIPYCKNEVFENPLWEEKNGAQKKDQTHTLFGKRDDKITYLDVFWTKWSFKDAKRESKSRANKQNDLTDLLLVLMFDKEFKEELFPSVFMRNYSELVLKQEKVLTRIAVQLFTIDRMLVEMTLDCELIKVIFYTTFQILQSCVRYYNFSQDDFAANHVHCGAEPASLSHTGEHVPRRVSCSGMLTSCTLPVICSHNGGENSLLSRKYTYPMHDYKYILQSIDLVTFIFLNRRTCELERELEKRGIGREEYHSIGQKYYVDLWHNGWLALLRLVQCVNPHNDDRRACATKSLATGDSYSGGSAEQMEDVYINRRLNRYLDDIKWRSSLLLSCDVQSTVDILLQILYILIGNEGNKICKTANSLSCEMGDVDMNGRENSFGIYRITVNTFQSLVQWFYISSVREKWNLRCSFMESVVKLDYVSEEYQPVRHFLLFELTQDTDNYIDYFLHDHSISKNSVSLHIPLHRAMIQLVLIYLSQMSRCNSKGDFNYIKELLFNIGLNNDLLKILLIEHPIRSYCFFFQTFYFNERFSLKNEPNRIGESQFYRKSHWSILYMISDLVSIRFYLNILEDGKHIVLLFNSILTHFGLRDSRETTGVSNSSVNGVEMGGNNMEENNIKELGFVKINIFKQNINFNAKMASCIHFIMDLLTKTNSIDMPISLTFNKSIYRYLLLQFLIGKERSRSEIQDGVPISSSASLYYGQFIQSINSSNSNIVIEEILSTFCDSIPASDKRPILYKMRQPLGWMLYDPVLAINFSNEGSSLSFTKLKVNEMCNWYEHNRLLVKNSGIYGCSDNFQENKFRYNKELKQKLEIFENKSKFKEEESLELEDEEKRFIDDKFFKFPMKLCHVPEKGHFVSLFNYKHSNNIYVLSIIFSNIIHLYLPKLFNISKNKTLVADPRAIQHSFILIFNLINIEIIKFVNSLKEKTSSVYKFEADFFCNKKDNQDILKKDVIFEYMDINKHFLNNNFHRDKQETFSHTLVNEVLVSNYFGVPKYSNCENSGFGSNTVIMMGYTEDLENDHYQYLLVTPELCDLLYSNLIEEKDLDNAILVTELNMENISQLLKKRGINNIFDLLTVPVKLEVTDGFENYKETVFDEEKGENTSVDGKIINDEFRLIDILMETIYSIRTREEENYLFINSKDTDSKYKFVNRDLLDDVSLEASYFLEWGLSIGRKASPSICKYMDTYMNNLYIKYKQEKMKKEKITNGKVVSQQETVIQRYMNRQKKFMMSNKKFFEDKQHLFSIENNQVEYCVFCHEEINIEDEHEINNLATFGFLDLQNISMNPRKNTNSFSTINGSYPIQNYLSMFMTICGHIIHYNCVDQYYKSFVVNNFHSNENLTITRFLQNNLNRNRVQSNSGSSNSNSNYNSDIGSDIDPSSNQSYSSPNHNEIFNSDLNHNPNSNEDFSDTQMQIHSPNHIQNAYLNMEFESDSDLSVDSSYCCSYYRNAPIVSSKGIVKVVINKYGEDTEVHELTSVKLGKEKLSKKRVLDYKSNYCFYHHTNLLCPYCKTNSNIILPFKTVILKEKRTGNNFLSSPNDASEILQETLNMLQAMLQNKCFGENLKGKKSDFCHLNVNISEYPLLQQMLPIANSFNYLLPHNLICNRIYVNGVLMVNPISILIKILSDNIIIDNIFSRDSNSHRSLFYTIIIDSIKNLIESLPLLGESLLSRLLPILNNSSSKMDIWDFISLQSPSSRFQLLLNYITLIDLIEKNGTLNLESNSNFSNRELSNEQKIKLSIPGISIVMLIIEIFSLIWTFWNNEWNCQLENGIKKGIKLNVFADLMLRYSKRNKFEVVSNCYSNKDEFSLLNFCSELINGSNFNMIVRYDRANEKIEYRAAKINAINKTKIFTNSYGALPILIQKPFCVFVKKNNPDKYRKTLFNDFSQEDDSLLLIDYLDEDLRSVNQGNIDDSIPEMKNKMNPRVINSREVFVSNAENDICTNLLGNTNTNFKSEENLLREFQINGCYYDYEDCENDCHYCNFEQEYIHEYKTHYKFSNETRNEQHNLEKINYIVNEQVFPNYDLSPEHDLRIEEISLNGVFKLKNIRELQKVIYYGLLTWLKCFSKFLDIYLNKSNDSNQMNASSEYQENSDIFGLKHSVKHYTEEISNKFGLKTNIFMDIIETLSNFDLEMDICNNSNDLKCEFQHESKGKLIESVINNILFIKILPLKKVFIPLTTLDVLVYGDDTKNHSNYTDRFGIIKQILNKNIGSYYKVLTNFEIDLLKKTLSSLSESYIHIDNSHNKVILINGYNQNGILLPKMYHNLYNKLISNQIKHWSGDNKSNMNQLLLCLSCGTILCTDFNCCSEPEINSVDSSLFLKSYFYCSRKNKTNSNGENAHSCYSIPHGTGLNMSFDSTPIKDHIVRCGSGLSFFLHISSSIVVCFRIDLNSSKNAGSNNIFNWIEPEKSYIYSSRGCEFSTLYVDEYGEEDKFLSRGKPLILCKHRLSKLQNSIQRYSIRRDSDVDWYPFQNSDSLSYFSD